MVIRKSILGPIIFITVFTIAVPIFIIINKGGNEKYQSFNMHGKVETVIYNVDGKRGFFIFVNNAWYNIIDIEAQEYITEGDSIFKEKGRKCFTLYRNQHDYMEICNSIIHKVNNEGVLYKLDHSQKKER